MILGHPLSMLQRHGCDHLLPSAGYCSWSTGTGRHWSAGCVWTSAPTPFRGSRAALHPAAPTTPSCWHRGWQPLEKGLWDPNLPLKRKTRGLAHGRAPCSLEAGGGTTLRGQTGALCAPQAVVLGDPGAGVSRCQRPVPAGWQWHCSGTAPPRLIPAALLPARRGSVWAGHAWGPWEAHGAKPSSWEQPDPVGPAGFAGGQELPRRPPGQPGRMSLLPCGSGNGQMGREGSRETVSQLLSIRSFGKSPSLGGWRQERQVAVELGTQGWWIWWPLVSPGWWGRRLGWLVNQKCPRTSQLTGAEPGATVPTLLTPKFPGLSIPGAELYLHVGKSLGCSFGWFTYTSALLPPKVPGGVLGVTHPPGCVRPCTGGESRRGAGAT